MYNLNGSCSSIFIGEFEFGKKQNIEVKIGRKFYLMDIDKNNEYTRIDFYRKLNVDRKKYSKYDKNAECSSVWIKNNALLNKKFFENIKDIENAQRIYRDFRCIK